MDPIGFPSAFCQPPGPLSGEFPQLPLRFLGNETRREEPMAQQIRDPHRIFDIGFATGDTLDVGRIHHPRGETAFQEIIHRLPIRAGRFHGYMRHPFGGEPCLQGEEIWRGGAKRLHDRGDPVRSGMIDTRDHTFFVDIESRTVRVEHIHNNVILSAPILRDARVARSQRSRVGA